MGRIYIISTKHCTLKLYLRMELGEEPLVEVGANVFKELCYNYRDSLMAGILVAGWDKKKGF